MVTIAESLAQAKAYHRAGRLREAEQIYRQVLQADSANAEVCYLLGAACQVLGKLNEAVAHLQQAVLLRPDHAETHNHLGVALARNKILDKAAACFGRAVQLKPDYAEAHYNLGTALRNQGKLDEAVASLRRAVQLKPDFRGALHHLAGALAQGGQLDEAISCYHRVVHLKPDHAGAHFALGTALWKQGRPAKAAAWLRRAVQLKPDHAEAHNNLAAALVRQQGQLDEAVACFQRAIYLKPAYHRARYNLGLALLDQGRLDEARDCFRKTLEMKPDYAEAHSSYLHTEHYCPGVRLETLALSHAEWDRRHGQRWQGSWKPHPNSRTADRPLRVGFVSPDFRQHPVGRFFLRTLRNLDPTLLETICYSTLTRPDVLTGQFRAAAKVWREVQGQSDEALADQVRADGVDILIDLAGHTANNRLPVFVRKPAPIQITWIGYEGTTGLAAMDYLLADRHLVPEGAEPHYREKVIRLPGTYVCFDPPAGAPEVRPLPALEKGHVTFGGFHKPVKVRPQVVEVWAEILRRVPGSRLVLKYRGFGGGTARSRCVDLFRDHGVGPDRLDFLDWSFPYETFLGHYRHIDLALDPFPFCGGATTCDALWMGVPVITCPGETFAGRHSLSYLSNVGLTETIAGDLREYVSLAVLWACDLPRLAGIRARLREQMAASPLCDGPRFAANLTGVLRDVWRQWVETRG